ncbi:MAG: ABC transporter ATP-binding protein [Planctomycetota bacterium]
MIKRNDAIVTRNLTKCFGRTMAARNLSLNIVGGQCTALIGHNGAGKTTLIRMLLGLIEPTRGSSHVLGHDSQGLPSEIRTRIGYLAEGHFLWPWMRVRDAVAFQKGTFPRWDQTLFDSILSYFGVSSNARVRQISRGQRAAVSLGLTLATDPEVLILDDPSMGLDPVARRALVEAFLSFARRDGRTILISTHQLDDVERLADRIALISNGSLLVDAELDDFRSRVKGWIVDDPVRPAAEIPRFVDARVLDGRTHIVVADPDVESEQAIQRLGSHCEEESLSFEEAVLAYLRPSSSVGSIANAISGGRS